MHNQLSELFHLEKYRQHASQIERQWDTEKKTLLTLPSRLGYKDADDLIRALQLASKSPDLPPGPTKRKKRVAVTPETKRLVKDFSLRRKTVEQISSALNISIGTVHNIRKQMGLVKVRSS